MSLNVVVADNVVVSGESCWEDVVRAGVQAAEPPGDRLLRPRVHGHPGRCGKSIFLV